MEQQLAVTAGASHSHRQDVALGHVSAMRFPSDITLPRHNHPQATIAVILAGGFSGSYRGGERDCQIQSVIVEPAGEQHANRFGHGETTILAVSLEATDAWRAVETAAGKLSFYRDPFAGLIARRAVNELESPDDVTPMALEAAAMEIVARVTRDALQDGRPAWLREVRDLVHDRYAESLSLADVAAVIGVEPERIARTFRRAFGEPLAGYVRRIRVDAAAAMLATTDVPISQVAADVGFSDQSHLTRCFGRYVGTTPGRYRREHTVGA
jgi:AraC family transcriptional regulator